MDNLYHKPYIQELYPAESTRVPQFPYPRPALLAEPLFPYYVMDGGAYFLARDFFGAADGDALCEKVMDGSLFEHWTGADGFDWDRSLSRSAGTDFTLQAEWQVWLQRLYILLPVAQKWAKTGERRYADKWNTLLHDWAAAHPYQPYEESTDIEHTDYVWRDMQVVWRMQTLLHSVYLLSSRREALAKEDWSFLYDLIFLHAEHELQEARHELKVRIMGNHFLQLGVSLVTVGAMFPEFEKASEYVAVGSAVVEMNLNGAIRPDGGSDEGSPSYSHFIARLYLECFLILQNNHLPMIPGLQESLQAQYRFLYQYATRTGSTLRFADAYHMDAHADIERVNALFPLTFSRQKETCLFPAIRCAVLRNERFEVFLDATPHIAWHQHYGRPQIAVYADGEPLLLDCGCVNYDQHDLREYLKSAVAHNVVEALETVGAKPETAITAFDKESNTITLTATTRYHGIWWRNTRTVILQAEAVQIEDRLEASEALHFTSNLHLSPGDTRLSEDGLTARQLLDCGILTVTTSEPMTWMPVPAMGEDNHMSWAVRLTRQWQGLLHSSKTELKISKR